MLIHFCKKKRACFEYFHESKHKQLYWSVKNSFFDKIFWSEKNFYRSRYNVHYLSRISYNLLEQLFTLQNLMFLMKHYSCCDDETLDRVEYRESQCLYNKVKDLKNLLLQYFISSIGVILNLVRHLTLRKK